MRGRGVVVVGGPGQHLGTRRADELDGEVVAAAGQVAGDAAGCHRAAVGARGAQAVGVEAPVGRGVLDQHRGRGSRRGQRGRGEPREAGAEVDRHGEPVGVPGQPGRLDLGHRGTAGQQPRRARLDVDHAAREVEGVEADHARAAVVAVLVVGDVQVHGVAVVVGQGGAPRRPVVPVEGEEDLVVAADQAVPQAPAVLGQHRVAVVGGDEVVRGEHDRQGRVPVDHLLGPADPLVGHAPVQRQQQPLPPTRADDVEAVVALGVEAGGGPHPGEPAGRERARVRGGGALVVGAARHVVVARQHAVGHPAVDRAEHRVGGAHLALGAVLGDVAQVGQEHHVRALEQRAQGVPDRFRVGAALVEEVLGVREHRDREAGVVRVAGRGPGGRLGGGRGRQGGDRGCGERGLQDGAAPDGRGVGHGGGASRCAVGGGPACRVRLPRGRRPAEQQPHSG